MKQKLVILVLIVSVSSCATYVDTIFGTELTFPKTELLAEIGAEVNLETKYYEINDLRNSEIGSDLSEIPFWTIDDIDATRTENKIDETYFTVHYILKKSTGQTLTFNEYRVSFSNNPKSIIIRDSFIEGFYPINSFEIADEINYHVMFTYEDENFYINFGKSYTFYGGNQLLTDIDIFSKNVLSYNSSDYSIIINFSDTSFYFTTLNKVESPLSGPWGTFKNDILLNFELYGNSANDFALKYTFLKESIKYAIESNDTEKLLEEIEKMMNAELFINEELLILNPEISYTDTRKVIILE